MVFVDEGHTSLLGRLVLGQGLTNQILMSKAGLDGHEEAVLVQPNGSAYAALSSFPYRRRGSLRQVSIEPLR